MSEECDDEKYCRELELIELHEFQRSMNAEALVPSNSMADFCWERIDPTPNLQGLFVDFDREFFANCLNNCVVSWSTQMKSSAGTCTYEGRGGLCTIRLSEPLLKFRSRKDMMETLLHEMIHAYLFLTANSIDREGHGPMFLEQVCRINTRSGLTIRVYHDFEDEVDYYKTHVWQCDGRCINFPPRFGIVKRSSNRDPEKDNAAWLSYHRKICGGHFVKISSNDTSNANDDVKVDTDKRQGKGLKGKGKKSLPIKNGIMSYFSQKIKGPDDPMKTDQEDTKEKCVTPTLTGPAENALHDIIQQSGDIVTPLLPNPEKKSSTTIDINPIIYEQQLTSFPNTKDSNSADCATSGRNLLKSVVHVPPLRDPEYHRYAPYKRVGFPVDKQASDEIPASRYIDDSDPVPGCSKDFPGDNQKSLLLNHVDIKQWPVRRRRNLYINTGVTIDQPQTAPRQMPTGDRLALMRSNNIMPPPHIKKSRDNSPMEMAVVNCPICNISCDIEMVNIHLDQCVEKNDPDSAKKISSLWKSPNISDERQSCPICNKFFPLESIIQHANNCAIDLYD